MRRRIWAATLLVVVVFAAGFLLGRAGQGSGGGAAPAGDHVHAQAAEEATLWTCSMHPQIQQPEPGSCPLCGMDLIPVESGSGTAGSGRQVELSPSARALARVATAPVERRTVATEIRMVGKIDYDETRLATISAWVPGRLDRLFVDYTGVPVRKGDHLVTIYSPELLTAQEELIQAAQSAREAQERGQSELRRVAQMTVEAAREKLRLWGLTPAQIEEIERRQTPSDQVTIYAPIAGIVVQKHAVEGVYVQTGSPIYTIADLSHLWVKLDAYESDLSWLRYGQDVELRTEAYPGEVFHGTIVFIDPVLDDRTRTIKVRVNVPNLDGKLKPEMFVRATVRAELGAGGKVVAPDLAGRWICPMHPEEVQEEPGDCAQCGMPLVAAEVLGYGTGVEPRGELPLVIPATAPLVTGKRAVVYVADPQREGVYTGREIELGPRAGDDYVVLAGLEEGEEVVTEGNFKIDSAVQIVAGPSMMSPAPGGGGRPGAPDGPHAGHAAGGDMAAGDTPVEKPPTRLDVPEAFRAQLDAVYDAYFDVQRALSEDDASRAASGADALIAAVQGVDPTDISPAAASAWKRDRAWLVEGAQGVRDAEEIQAARNVFEALSLAATDLVQRFGSAGDEPILRYHCPMAFDWRGAYWLQEVSGTANPYYGSAMYKCGSEVAVLHPGDAEAGDEAGSTPEAGGASGESGEQRR